MIRKTLLAVAALSLLGSAAIGAPCKDPKTGTFIKCPPPATAAAKPKVWKTGKPCGNSCIAKDKACHKP